MKGWGLNVDKGVNRNHQKMNSLVKRVRNRKKEEERTLLKKANEFFNAGATEKMTPTKIMIISDFSEVGKSQNSPETTGFSQPGTKKLKDITKKLAIISKFSEL